eukprot:5339312-Amphidinium_carterae.2
MPNTGYGLHTSFITPGAQEGLADLLSTCLWSQELLTCQRFNSLHFGNALWYAPRSESERALDGFRKTRGEVVMRTYPECI